MGQFDQFANQGGAAAWDPAERAEAKRIAEEQLNNADLSGEFPEPLGGGSSEHDALVNSTSDDTSPAADGAHDAADGATADAPAADTDAADIDTPGSDIPATSTATATNDASDTFSRSD